MSVQLQCPRCQKRWSVDGSKVPGAVACPICKVALVRVGLSAAAPARKTKAPAEQAPGGAWSDPSFRIAVLGGGALVALVAVFALVLILWDLGQSSTPSAQATARATEPTEPPPPTNPEPKQTE